MHTRIPLALTLGLAACGQPFDDPPAPPPLDQAEQKLNGFEGMFEFAIDVPWRIEPQFDELGGMTYDAVPITIAIHDEDTNPYSGSGRLYDFCGLTIARYRNGTLVGTQTFQPSQLEWMEYTGRPPGAPTNQAAYWPTNSQGLLPPTTLACYPGRQDCSAYTKVYGTSEWHALLKWNPGFIAASNEETLKLTAKVSAAPGCQSRQISLINYAHLQWSGLPLPRFDDERWLYGDLHYHSQSTDNEGESGYSYRAVTAALGAMGIDFTFATDHASDSAQVVDIDRADWDDILPERFRGLRDLNQARWDAALFKLHSYDGANVNVAESWPQHRMRIPRLFLGAEVDVTPEVGLAPTSIGGPYWTYPYGNNLTFDIFDWTTDGYLAFGGPSLTVSQLPGVFPPFTDRSGLIAYMLGDTQGFNERYVGRQHMLYLPRHAYQLSGFVGSRTTKYGGASRHAIESNGVESGILPEISSKQGIAFLAHPLAGGGGGHGPGMAPYSEYQYTKLFEQQALVGLQLWNENVRMSSAGCYGLSVPASGCINIGEYESTGYEWMGATSGGSHMPGWNAGEYKFTPMWDVEPWIWRRIHFGVEHSLHQGTTTWDRLLRWGLDEGRTQSIPWLPAGEPRRLFMAGGSDAHGDWSYRREGYAVEPESTNDTALARVRNLVFAGRSRTGCRPGDWLCFDVVPPAHQTTHDQPTVTDALGEGRFAVTDGPAVRVVVDRNRNGVIDDDDYPMGSVVELYNGEPLPVLVEWHSTPEFGEVDSVDLYVGVDSQPQCVGECTSPINPTRARTYAPPGHGVRRDPDEVNDLYVTGAISDARPADPQALPCAGRCQMADGYWLPAEGPARDKLRHVPAYYERQRGVYAVSLNLDDYPSSASTAATPTRAYVRAFVRTKRTCDLKSSSTPTELRFGGHCLPRFGFANPVWALRKTYAAPTCPLSERSLDRDLDMLPDSCDPEPSAAVATTWTRMLGGTGWDSVSATAFDFAGNLYVAARTSGAVRIERGGGATMPLTGPDIDAVLLKFNPKGELVGSLPLTGPGAAYITDLAVDYLGYVILTGYFGGTMQIGDGALTSPDGDSFVARVRPTDWSVLWVRQLSGSGYSRATGVTVTNEGNVAVLGHFTGAFSTGNSNLTADGTAADCFVAQFALVGGFQRAIARLGGTGDCAGTQLVSDSQSNVYLAGTYNGVMTVGGFSQTSTSRDAFVVRLDSVAAGMAPLWVTWVGTPTSNADALINDLVVLPSGEVLVGGRFNSTLYAARNNLAFTLLGSATSLQDMLLLKLARADGSATLPPVWRLGGNGDDVITALAKDASGRVLATGYFTSTSITTSAGTLVRNGASDLPLLLFDSSLQLTWARDYGTTSYNAGAAVAFSNASKLAFGGYLMGPPSAGDRDGFATVMPVQ